MITAFCFAVSHSSYIVNLNYIRDFNREGIALTQASPAPTVTKRLATGAEFLFIF